MSSFKRFVEIAKSEVGALRDRVTGRNLEDFTDDELSAEIDRRRLERELRERRDAERAAAQEAKRAKDGAATADASSKADPPAGASKVEPPRPEAPEDPGRAARSRSRAGSGVGKTLAQYYANLEVPVGADLETVKRAYRKLMRRYHPDRHADDPAKFKAATELAQSLTRAYMEVKKHLEGTRS